MSATDHTKHYSAADIQRYLAGDLSPADMHALELAALDDPFLADAIEGMQQSLAQQNKTPIDTDLQELQRKLQERVAGEDRRQSAPVVAFRWWQAAAAAAVIIIGSIWIFNASQESASEAKDIAMVQTQEERRRLAPAMATDSVAISSNIVADSPVDKAAAPSTGKANSKTAAKEEETFNVTEKQADEHVGLQKTYQPLPTIRPTLTEAKDARQHDDQTAAAKTHQPAATRNTLNYEHIREDSNRIAPAKKNLASQRNQAPAPPFNNTLSRDFEQIVVSKTPRDTSAAGYLSKPRELTMNMSRKELSARQAKKNPDALLSGFVSGRVTDNATNSPISNAMVRIEGNRDYFTDNKGWFKIPTTDSVVNVAVGTSGYYTQNLRLNNNSSNLISLNQLGDKAPYPTLNVLQGRVAGIQVNQVAADSFQIEGNARFNYADAKAADSTFSAHAFKTLPQKSKANPLAQHAEPVYGWVKFQQYLDQNKQLPADGAAGAGKVVVTFEIDKKGVPAAFTIVSSPGQAYSDEAIRLIKAGPSWKLLKGRKANTTVVITF